MAQTAVLEVRVLPWRPKARVMDAKQLREVALDNGPIDSGGDDLAGIVIIFGLWLAIVLAAPLVVLLLVGALLSVELPVVLAAAVLLLVARFAGLVPWTVLVADPVSGKEQRYSHRNIVRAIGHIRGINGEPRVGVRWSWV